MSRTLQRTTRTIAACALLATTAAACSSSKHTGGATAGATTIAQGSTAAGGTGGGTGTGANGTGTGSNGTSTASSGGSGGSSTSRTTVPVPTTTPPSATNYLKAHARDLRSLKTSVGDVNAAFQANDDKAKTTALVACANAAAPLARSATGSLPTDQADALTTISDECASMTHDLKSGDTAAVDTGKIAFDKAVVVVTPLFP